MSPRARGLSWGLAPLVWVFACGGETLDIGYDDSRIAAGGVDGVDGVIDVAAAQRRCAAPDTPDEPADDSTTMRALLTGRWLACDGEAGVDAHLPNAIAFETGTFVPLTMQDGRLLPDGSMRRAYQISKDLSCCYPAAWLLDVDGAKYVFVLQRGPLRLRVMQHVGNGSAPRPLLRRYVRV